MCRSPQRPEDGVSSPGASFGELETGSCDLLRVGAGTEPGSPGRAVLALTLSPLFGLTLHICAHGLVSHVAA